MKMTVMLDHFKYERWNKLQQITDVLWKNIPQTVAFSFSIFQYLIEMKGSASPKKFPEKIFSYIENLCQKFCTLSPEQVINVSFSYGEMLRSKKYCFAEVFLGQSSQEDAIKILNLFYQAWLMLWVELTSCLGEEIDDRYRLLASKYRALCHLYEELILFPKKYPQFNLLLSQAFSQSETENRARVVLEQILSQYIVSEANLEIVSLAKWKETHDERDLAAWCILIPSDTDLMVSLPVSEMYLEPVKQLYQNLVGRCEQAHLQKKELLDRFELEQESYFEFQANLWQKIQSGAVYSLRPNGLDWVELDFPFLETDYVRYQKMTFYPAVFPNVEVGVTSTIAGFSGEWRFKLAHDKFSGEVFTGEIDRYGTLTRKLLYHIALACYYMIVKDKQKFPGRGNGNRVVLSKCEVEKMVVVRAKMVRLPPGHHASRTAKNRWGEDRTIPWTEMSSDGREMTFRRQYELNPDAPYVDEPLFKVDQQSGLFA